MNQLGALLQANIRKYRAAGKSETWIQGYISGWNKKPAGSTS